MEFVLAAALLAAAIVIASIVARGRSASAPTAVADQREQDLTGRERQLDRRDRELSDRAEALGERERRIDHQAADLATLTSELRRREDQIEQALERTSGLSASAAKAELLRRVEEQTRHEEARVVRRVEEQTRREAERRVRSILSTAMQRYAAGHAAETTVSVVKLPGDDMKGRIIGREGRNIRALEHLTGVNFIIDDTPGAVVLSSFDGVRREVARRTLEALMEDGRIHPAKIEEAYFAAKAELEEAIQESGEAAVLEADVQGIHPDLVQVLGKLRFRTSYGQNVLAHSVECAILAGLLAHELGADAATARRAALLHDIGKAVSHEVEGPHALVGGQLARRHGEAEAVAHAMEAHHNEVDPQTVEAVIVQAADALSGARPGARGESLELYVRRLRDLESIAARHQGVDRVYAMQAGREVRIIVLPEAVDDDQMTLLARSIAREIEDELEYPGQIKVTVIRESRASDFAR
ncbi:Hydrolase (HAD superfamily) [Patulibacter medicamentivorans]|jgi:ribonuclease Y|uniref:Ribonuclease Y n=1 Tax=Patulibacter medicamentivorans TaxID=1097667 RepID=H0E2U4_9ACTN|nr:ribonuclease Y [Patulibacter medicamentivorans]EHN12022.1 Hydrolase (HAD superfamily) [Patulibacter medicamentivorans]